MGAKQSKRSVDISGKEAESAGEVAASIAGGEGRVEQLADSDALKPQLNGDAHIHEVATEEKQKDLDSGTPENEKDATTEKEGKQDAEPDVAPLTNGDSEQKVENGGETTPTSEEGKKPKKEKVKKKWSLRSISFSRKDKPKHEKKSKDEEAKTNGEPEKVPEETAEVASEAHVTPVITETPEEAKTPSEAKEDKTPETPVTEPITNGSSTPESPKVETPVVEEPVVAAPSPVIERPESKPEIEPEQLPVNGLSLQESVQAIPENEKKDDSKEETTAETTESVPEIPVKKEVCVDQMPLIDSTPPPLPANPPPSSVATFAATTMAPELTDASLPNTADNAIPPLSTDPIKTDEIKKIPTEPKDLTAIPPLVNNKLPSPQKTASDKSSSIISEDGENHDNIEVGHAALIKSNSPALVENVAVECPPTIDKLAINTVMLVENITPATLTPLFNETKMSEMEIENEQLSVITEQAKTASEVIADSVVGKEEFKKVISETASPSPPSDLNATQNENEPSAEVREKEPEIINCVSAEIVESSSEIKNVDISSPQLKSEDDSLVYTEVVVETAADNVCLPIQDIIHDKVVTKEIVLDNTDMEMLPPPSEIIEEDAINKDVENEYLPKNVTSDLPAPPVGILEDNNIDKCETSSISESDLPAPPAEDSEVDLNVENLPTPPPSLCEEVSISTSEQNEEILPASNDINFDSKIENVETSPEEAIKNNNDDNERNLKNKSKDSLGNFIDTIECNGNFEKKDLLESVEVMANSVKEITDVEIDESGLRTAASNKEIADIAIADSGLRTEASHDKSSDERAGSEPAIPQDPVSEKLADLIPEVPEVPQIITETAIETTNDVAVAN